MTEEEHRSTVAIPRDELLDLVAETAVPDFDRVLAHTVPRDRLSPLPLSEEEAEETTSPLAVFAVIVLLVTVFIAVTRLS